MSTRRASAADTRARLKAARGQVAAETEDTPATTDTTTPSLAAVSPQASTASTDGGQFDAAAAPAFPDLPTAVQAPTAPAELPRDLPGSTNAVGGQHQKPTGIDVPADLHERVQREAQRRSRGGHRITQTEIVLHAFETVYERLPALIASHNQQQQVASPLFGTRTVHAAPKIGAMKRLQIRPTYDQKNRLHALAEHFGLPLSDLTRIVLREYFHPGA
jgi:hypothetical protein